MGTKSDSGLSAAFQSIIRGGAIKVVGTSAMRALGFFTTYLLTTALNPTLYGLYAYGKVLMDICNTIANFGTDQSIVRFVPDSSDQDDKNRVIGLSILTSLIGSSLLGVALYYSAPLITQITQKTSVFVPVLQLFAITLPAGTLVGCVGSVFRSQERAGYQVLSNGISNYIFRIVALAAVVLVGATLVNVVLAEVVASFLTLLFAMWLFFSKTEFKPSLSGSSPSLKRFYSFSAPLTLGDTGRLLQNRIDILMVGFFLPGSAIGIYNLSNVLSQLLYIPSVALDNIYPSIAARMYGNDELDELDSLFTRVNRWSFTFSLLPAVGIFVFAEEALSVFGEGFAGGSEVLMLFAITSFANAATGPTGYTLMMTDHQYLILANRWGAGVANAVLNFIFITQFGLLGAATATLCVTVAMNAAYVVEIWYTEGMIPYSLNFLKPIAAGLVCGAVLIGWKSVSPISGLPFLIVGAIIGTVAFAFVLVVLGIEAEDQEFLAEIASRVNN